jgi:hypothetical protein
MNQAIADTGRGDDANRDPFAAATAGRPNSAWVELV